MKEIVFATSKNLELIDITGRVASAIVESGVKEGIALVYAPHATGIILMCENEEGLKHDLLHFLQRLLPAEARYRHSDGNAHAHLMSSLIGCSETIPVAGGKPCLGTWQSIFFLETDGPRPGRRVIVEVLGKR